MGGEEHEQHAEEERRAEEHDEKHAQRRRAFSATGVRGRRALVHLWVEDERRLKNEEQRGADGDKEEELRPHGRRRLVVRRWRRPARREREQRLERCAQSNCSCAHKRPGTSRHLPRGSSHIPWYSRAPTGRGSEEEVGDEPPCVSLLVCV